MPLTIGLVLVNRYRVVRLLGQGGFGAVYRAWDINVNRPCAIKENLDTSAEAQRQFAREAMVLANLTHPNLPRVTDHFLIEGQGQYLVMDFIEGEDLEMMVKRQGPVAPEQALPWVAQVADALEYLHSRQPPVLHRDIKPANIRVTPEGKAVLVDFGLVKVYDPNLRTTLGARAVTPGYSPPEQYGQGSTDARADIYALGATLYHMLTGQDPAESVQRMVGNISLRPANQMNPAVSEVVERALETSMALTPSQRYQSVGDFRAALKETSTRPVAPPVAVPVSQPVKDRYTVEKGLPAKAKNQRLWLFVVPILVLILAGVTWMAGSTLLAGGKTSTPTPTATATRVPASPTMTAAARLLTATTYANATRTATPQKTATPGATVVTTTATPTQISSPSPTSSGSTGRTTLPTPTKTQKPAPKPTKPPQATNTPRPPATATPRPPATSTPRPPADTATPKPPEPTDTVPPPL